MKELTPTWKTKPLHVCCAALLLATGATAALAADAPTVVPEQQLERVSVRDVQLEGDGVRALVVNQSEQRLEDLTLRVSYQWRWSDEFHPGSDNPGFSDTLQMETPLAPGEQREVRYDPPQALPERSDGSFSPQVSVVSFTAYEGGDPQASNP